ncbi:head completion protein [Serratia phage vB_SmaM-Kamaji]|nr:head completion protein [Serratia phage vB_SmaM-Kamaji]
MKIIDDSDYRTFIGAKRPETPDSVSMFVKAANTLITNAMGYSDTTEDEDILNTRPARTKYFLSSPSASRILSATHTVLGDVSNVIQLRKDGVILTQTKLPDGELIVEYEDGGMSSIPDDLKVAACLLVQHWDKKEYRSDKTFGGETVSFNTTKSGIPEHIRTIIELYRRL